MLFPPLPVTRPPANLWDERASAPTSTAPKASSVINPNLVASNSPRRHSVQYPAKTHQQKTSGSPVQAPRVTELITQSAGFSLSNSYRYSPSSRKQLAQRFYSASAVPSNSPHSKRHPPVPLFNSTGHPPQTQNQNQVIDHRRVMSAANVEDLHGLFDLTSSIGDDAESPLVQALLSPYHYAQSSFTAVNDIGVPGQSTGTVSPKDLMMDGSAPPSTSFTDLSTPSFESPGLFSHDTSPAYPDQELGPGHEEWDPLFPTESLAPSLDEVDAALMVKTGSPASPMIRDLSSSGYSPGSDSAKAKNYSSVAGINSRRREKPLPPIKFDGSDPIAVKRARNTEAARKSRARKVERNDAMERRIAELEKSLEESQRREQYWRALAENHA